MMYQEKMAVTIKANNRVLREFKDTVYLPFGSEYSFLIKNLHTRRALVKIEIDGRDVTGGGLVVRANSSVDLERFIVDNNLDKGNKFKFIERTAKVEQARGVGLEDGLVRIEFEFEREYPSLSNIDWTKLSGSTGNVDVDAIATTWLSNSSYDPTFTTYSNAARNIGGTTTLCASGSSGLVGQVTATSASFVNQVSAPKNDAGITVQGSVSEQKFTLTTIQTDGVKHVMVFKLLGETEQGKVEAPVTVKSKPKCVTCHHLNKATSKFCSECGTSLYIV